MNSWRIRLKWPFLSCVTQQMILCIRCFITTGNIEFAYGDESHVTHFLTVSYPDNCSICTRELGGWSVLNVQRDSFGHLVSDTQLCWVTFREDRGCRTWWVTFMWLWSGKYLLLNRVFSLMFYYWMLNLLLNPFQFLNLKCVVHLWSSHF